MRRFQHHVTFWGGSFLTGHTPSSGQAAPTVCTSKTLVPANPVDSVVNGMVQFEIFPNTNEVICKLASNGVAADWANVGKDLGKVMKVFGTQRGIGVVPSATVIASKNVPKVA